MSRCYGDFFVAAVVFAMALVGHSTATELRLRFQLNQGNSTVCIPVFDVNGNAPNVTIDWGDNVTVAQTNLTLSTCPGSPSGIASALGIAYTYNISLNASLVVDVSIYDPFLDIDRFGWASAGYTWNELQVNTSIDFLGVLSWQNLTVTSLARSFAGATAAILTVPPTLPEARNDTTGLSLEYMFEGCLQFNAPEIVTWNTRQVTTLRGAFAEAFVFDQPIGTWNVTRVSDFAQMFRSAFAFNKPIGPWSIPAAITLESMFESATSLNQSVRLLDSFNVVSFSSMFSNAVAFQDTLEELDVTAGVFFSNMFFNAAAFNGNISHWNVTNAVVMDRMFFNAVAFSQNLTAWCVPKIFFEPPQFVNPALVGSFDASLHPIWGTCGGIVPQRISRRFPRLARGGLVGRGSYRGLAFPDDLPVSVLDPIRVDLQDILESQSALFTDIGCGGFDFFVALLSNNKLVSWGANQFGQLGIGFIDASAATRPTLVDTSPLGSEVIVDLRCGASHVVALTLNGKLYGWGANNAGQLGLGDLGTRSLPTEIPLLDPLTSTFVPIFDIGCGSGFCIAQSADNKAQLYGFGTNANGELGDGTLITPRTTLQRVDMTAFGGQDILGFVTTSRNTLAWTRNPIAPAPAADTPAIVRLFAWGGSDDTNPTCRGDATAYASPALIDINNVLQDGSLRFAGAYDGGSRFRFAIINTADNSTILYHCEDVLVTPVQWRFLQDLQIEPSRDVKTVRFLDGSNDLLYLADRSNPSDTWVFDTETFRPMDMSRGTTAFFNSTFNSDLWVVDPVFVPVLSRPTLENGTDAFVTRLVRQGQAGPSDSVLPLDQFLSDAFTDRFEIGRAHYATVRNNGSVWLYGDNTLGQLGLGVAAPSYVPEPGMPIQVDNTLFPGIPLNTSILQVALGSDHTVVLLSDGSVWSWGSNSQGQLCIGGTSDSMTPVQIALIDDLGRPFQVHRIHAGYNNTVLVTRDRNDTTLLICGKNSDQQAGISEFGIIAPFYDVPTRPFNDTAEPSGLRYAIIEDVYIGDQAIFLRVRHIYDGRIRLLLAGRIPCQINVQLSPVFREFTAQTLGAFDRQVLKVSAVDGHELFWYAVAAGDFGSVRACGDPRYSSLFTPEAVVQPTPASNLTFISDPVERADLPLFIRDSRDLVANGFIISSLFTPDDAYTVIDIGIVPNTASYITVRTNAAMGPNSTRLFASGDVQRNGQYLDLIPISLEVQPRSLKGPQDTARADRLFFSATFSMSPIAPPDEPPVDAPIEPPIEPPIEAPVAPPADPPADAPVNAPIAAPIEPPVAAPVEVPVNAPLDAPVDAPFATPVDPPANTPEESPQQPPIDSPIVVPPSMAPVNAPVMAPVSLAPQVPVSALRLQFAVKTNSTRLFIPFGVEVAVAVRIDCGGGLPPYEVVTQTLSVDPPAMVTRGIYCEYALSPNGMALEQTELEVLIEPLYPANQTFSPLAAFGWANASSFNLAFDENWGSVNPSFHLLNVASWGDATLGLLVLDNAFANVTTPGGFEVPPVFPATVMQARGMFRDASTFDDPSVMTWDMANVLDMRRMFSGATAFNVDIGNWNVINVRADIGGMDGLFANANSFNRDLRSWCVPLALSLDAPFEFAVSSPLPPMLYPRFGNSCFAGVPPLSNAAPQSSLSTAAVAGIAAGSAAGAAILITAAVYFIWVAPGCGAPPKKIV